MNIRTPQPQRCPRLRSSSAIGCDSWRCAVCAGNKAEAVRRNIEKAIDTSLADNEVVRSLTITLSEKNPQLSDIKPRWTALTQIIRRNPAFGSWFRAIEIGDNGRPHLHVIEIGGVRESEAIWKEAVLRAGFGSQFAAHRVSRRSSAKDLANYLTKGVNDLVERWDAFGGGKHITPFATSGSWPYGLYEFRPALPIDNRPTASTTLQFISIPADAPFGTTKKPSPNQVLIEYSEPPDAAES
jgi:hypothetical protein